MKKTVKWVTLSDYYGCFGCSLFRISLVCYVRIFLTPLTPISDTLSSVHASAPELLKSDLHIVFIYRRFDWLASLFKRKHTVVAKMHRCVDYILTRIHYADGWGSRCIWSNLKKQARQMRVKSPMTACVKNSPEQDNKTNIWGKKLANQIELTH